MMILLRNPPGATRWGSLSVGRRRVAQEGADSTERPGENPLQPGMLKES